MFSVLASIGSSSDSKGSKESKAFTPTDKFKMAKLTVSAKKRERRKKAKARREAELKTPEGVISTDDTPKVVNVTENTSSLELPQVISPDKDKDSISAPGKGIEEQKEEVISVHSSPEKSTAILDNSSYLLSMKATNDLMDQLVKDLNVKMSKDFEFYIRYVLHMPIEVTECLNICMLIDPESMRDFACHAVKESMMALPMSAILHPHVLSTCMFAHAFGMNWQRLLLTYKDPDHVGIELVTSEDVIEEFKKAHQSGIRAFMEQMIARRIREYHGFPSRAVSESVTSRSTRKSHESSYDRMFYKKGGSIRSPLIVDSSSSDDASDITDTSEPKVKVTTVRSKKLHPVLETVPEIPSEEKRGIQNMQNMMDSKEQSSPQKKSQHVNFGNSTSPFIGTLLDLTRLDPKVAGDILDKINLSKISTKSSTVMSEDRGVNTSRESAISPQKEVERVEVAPEGSLATPDLRPLPSALTMTPEERHALEYMAKIRALTPDVKEVKRASLPSSVKFSGDIEKFDDFRDAVEGHYRQQQASYLFNEDFIKQYEQFGSDCYVNFTGLTSANQVTKDVEALYGALQTACQKGSAKSILLKYKKSSNGVAAWSHMVERFGSDGDFETRIDKLERVVNTPFSKSYKGGLRAWLKDYENAFAELEVLGESSYMSDASKKRKIIQNCVPKDSKDAMIIRELCVGKSYQQTCKMIRQHALLSDNKRTIPQVNKTTIEHLVHMMAQQLNLPSREDEVEVEGNDSVSDDNTMVMANLTRINMDVWKELPRDVQELIIKARREENAKGRTFTPRPEKDNKPKEETLPKQYSKPKVNLTTTSDIVEEFLEQALGQSGEEEEDEDDLVINAFNLETIHVSISEEQVVTCMNSMFIEENRKLVIMDNGADTSVVGNGWEVTAINPIRKAHVIGFDHKVAIKKNLDIVTAFTVVEINDTPVLFQINEAVYNPTAEHSLLSEYQLRDFGVKVNSVPKKHGGEQNLIIQDQEVPCGVKNCLIYFKCRLPTDEEMDQLTPVVLTQGESPWNPKAEAHNSPINDSFYKEVIAAAKADAETELEESQILQTKQLTEEEAKIKSEAIYVCMAALDSQVKGQEVSSSLMELTADARSHLAVNSAKQE